MALTKGDRIRAARTLWGGSIPTLTFPEGTAAAWDPGEPLIHTATTGGWLKLAATANAVDVVGIAMTSGTAPASSLTTDMQVVPAIQGVIFEGSIAGDAQATLALAATHMFGGFQLERDASNKVWALNMASTSNAVGYVVGFRDATGTVHGRVYFTFSTVGRSPIWQ